MTKHRAGFTLVELSIVLVILGLLVGGVLTGQSLIRAAELRSVSTQMQRFLTAAHTFRDKYLAYPGDLPNATAYWGEAASGTACATTAGTGTLTCNGNGDGFIMADNPNSNELFRFWQHLANAGMIEGNYDGIEHGSGLGYASTTANSPVGRIGSSMWFMYTQGPVYGHADRFDGEYGTSLEFGGILPNSHPEGPILKPEDAYNVDMKTDDGKPATGKVVVRNPAGLNTCTDTASNSTLTASYLLTGTAPACALMFRNIL